MGFFKDFKDFAVKGNVMDLAVGVIIGGAFGKIVSSLVNDVLMPVVGMVSGDGKKFTDKFFILKSAKEGETYASLADARAAGANVFAYGSFIQTVVDFLIIAFCVFLMVRGMKRITEKREKEVIETPPAAPPPPSVTPTEKLLMEIRDELKKQSS